MKKTLLISSLIITFLGVLFTSSPYLLRVSGLDEPLKQYLLPKIFNSPEDQLDFKSFRIGLSTIYLNDVSATAENKSIQLHIDAIQINFNFMRLLQNPADPKATITAIRFVEPKVTIDYEKQTATLSSAGQDTQKTQLRNMFEAFNQIRSIQRIAISDGQVDWIGKGGTRLRLAYHINGWLDTRDFNNVLVESEGNLFASEVANFRFSAAINPLKKKLQAKVSFSDSNIPKTLRPLLPEDWALLDGDVQGEIQIRSKRLHADSTFVNGMLEIKKGALRKGDHLLTDIRCLTEIKQNRLIIHKGSGYYAGQLFDFSADVENIFVPHIRASLTSKYFALSEVKRYLPLPALARSKVDLTVDFETDLNTYEVNAAVRSDSLFVLKDDALKHVNISLSFKDNQLRLKKFGGRFYGWDIYGNGVYDQENNRVRLSLDGDAKLAEYSILDRLSNKKQSTRLRLTYQTDKRKFSGNWAYSIAAEEDTVFASAGRISGNDRQLDLILSRSSHPGFFLRVAVQNFLSERFNLQAALVNYPLAAFTSDPSMKKIFNRFVTDTRLSGTFSQLKGQVQVKDLQNERNSFRLNTVAEHPFSSYRRIKGSVRFRNLLGFYDVEATPEKINTTLRFPAGISGKISFSPGLNDAINGLVRFDDFNILQTMTDSTLAGDFRLQGTINGEVAVNGTVHDPILIARLAGDKFVFNEIGYYQASLYAVASKNRVSVDSMAIRLNNIDVMTGRGSWDPSQNLIDFSFSGEHLDIQQITTSLTGKDNLFSGDGSFAISLSGSVDRPQIQARLAVNNGYLQDLAFDELRLSIEDHFNDLARFYDWSQHTLLINKFYLATAGRYHLTADGIFPMNEKDPLDMELKFDGDLLSFIPYWESFFVDGASLATLDLQIEGTRKDIRVKRGKMQIERGELWLRDVAPHIENISGTIEFVEGTNQIDIKNLLAYVDGSALRINTKRNVTLPDGRKLKHWYFKNLDLDFGVLTLETSRDGVEVHIPGLMRDDEAGYFYLTGQHPGHPFYFAGPVRNPQAIGKVVLYNTYLTYPFIIKNDAPKKPSVAVRFLSKIDWDLLVKSGEDVIFFRDIPAFIDNVNMELYVDETSKGLRLRGIINEGTFKPEGELVSTRGQLEYLDQVFRVDRFSAEFTRNNPLPFIAGRAWTTIRDSVGAIPKTIYLDLYAVDEETGIEKQEGNWENFRFKLVSADPQIGETQEQVLAYLGFSVGNVKQKAVQVGGAVTERYLIRPLLRPVERALEKSLGMDLVRINSAIARNLFYSTLGTPTQGYGSNYYINPFVTNTSYLMLMQSSGLTVGKYLSRDLFVTYTGQLVSVANHTDVEFGINHSFGIEYRFLKNVLVEFKYDRELFGLYGSQYHQQYLEDFKIRLRHSFSF